ncbi:MAG TPA: RluA family pseudouridine synthase [Egibacteraceae bacterium]|nr:RluA family pseudouridine synthase [Egibacteraceae bacterium]
MTLLDRTVGPEDEGSRADVAVAGWLGEPRSRAQSRIEAGEVTVDGVAVAKSHRLRAGERVRVARREEPPAPVPGAVPIRYADAHLLVVAKPAGLVVHAGAGPGEGSLVDALAAMGVALADPCGPHDGPCPTRRPGIVHRLDRGTSGLLAVAKTVAAYEGLAALFRAHDVERVYTALVDGVPDPPSATIDAPIARSATRRTRFTVDSAGRRAVSHYDVDEDFTRAAALTVRLETGRTHQVRVHLAAVGHPVSGDRAYGASAALAAELGLDRPALHARRLAFTHPLTGERVSVEEPPPPDIARARDALRAPSR